MNHWLQPILAALVGALQTQASPGVVTVDDRSFQVGEWSSATALTVDSDEGQTSLVRRTCEVTPRNVERPPTSRVEWLTHPGSHEVWFGASAQRYVVLGGRIWGVSAATPASNLLLIGRSEPAGERPPGEEWANQKLLDHLRNEPRNRYSSAATRAMIDLHRVFGLDGTEARLNSNASRGAPRRTEISGITVDHQEVTVTLKDAAARELSLTLGPALEILQASKAGKPVLVLWDGVVTRWSGRPTWSAPIETEVKLPEGRFPALRCDGWLLPTNTATASATVLTATGDLWIGPAACQWVLQNGKAVGAMLSETGDLLIFTRSLVRLPFSPESSRVFAKELRACEEQFRASQSRFQPDFQVSKATLLSGQGSYPLNSRMRLSGVSFRGENVNIRCSRDPAPNYPTLIVRSDPAYLDVELGPDFAFRTNHVRTTSEVSQEPKAPDLPQPSKSR